ncbi:tetratricopeptide repeat-containing diguanylate cyclase [Shewanella aestuarii]|uniref:Diguanylate cyclase n=1 Tax=Shewanella aestuarii TaxID=1028752 RepID=A0A6G9QFN2_9GAMM|nr:diguanylate cyclase [Shewanella aestuarii]QIR13276.1 diguanylate cyclase [Shewanella aestuarii]
MKSLFCLLHIFCATLTSYLVFSNNASASDLYKIDLSHTEFTASTTSQKLDYIAWLSPQYPSRTQELIASLAQQSNTLSDSDNLRLMLLSCLNYNDLGQSESALNVASRGIQLAAQLKLEITRPYFLNCKANAFEFLGDQTQLVLANEESIRLAQQYVQPQALISGLLMRSLQSNFSENFADASENLKMALSLYPSAEQQLQTWYLIPKFYLQLVMSNLLFSSGDHTGAMSLTKEIQKDPQANGQVATALNIYLARFAISAGDTNLARHYLTQAKFDEAKINNTSYNAVFNAHSAYIELHIGNLKAAENSINSSIHYFSSQRDKFQLIRAQRTLAMIYFAQNRNTDALALMSDIISQATQYEQYYDLIDFNQILSDYYQKQGDFENAFYQQNFKYAASQKAHAKLSNTHIAQLKADRESINNIIAYSDADASSLTFKAQNIALLSLGILILLASFMFFVFRKPTPKMRIDQEDEQQQTELILHNAKQGNYPLSLLLLNISAIREVDVAIVQNKLQQALREQDYIVRKNTDEMMILLPYTSEKGAQRVAMQLTSQVQAFQSSVVNFGVANLQQLDSVETLTKRASLNLLSQIQKKNQNLV